MNKKRIVKEQLFTFVMLIIFVVCLFSSIFLGTENISPISFIQQLIQEKQLATNNNFSYITTIIFQIRIPRTILVILSGMLLGGTGAILQGFFRNPLSDTSILGISSGAAFGGAIGSVITTSIFSTSFLMNIFAFFGAIICAIILISFSRARVNNFTTTALLLTGTALSSLFSAGASIVLLFKSKELRSIFIWTLGSFNGRGWNELRYIIIPAVVSLFLLLYISRFLDILASGETKALTLGLNINLIMILTLIGTSLSTAASVCSGGIIGFVGLISPHITRSFCSIRHKQIVPLSMLTGAVILLLSDILARLLLQPVELPIGIITSIIGAPIFLHILKKYKKA